MPPAARRLRREREDLWDRVVRETEDLYPRTPHATMSVTLGADGRVPRLDEVFSDTPAQFTLEYLGRSYYTSPVLLRATWGDVWQLFVDARNTMVVAGVRDEHRFLERLYRRRVLGGAAARDLHPDAETVTTYGFGVGS